MHGFTKRDLTRGTTVVRVQNAADAHDTNITAAARLGTVVTSDVTAHTKGAYVELIASTGAVGYGLSIKAHASSTNATVRNMLLDIAVGDAGSEVIIIPNLQVGAAGIVLGANSGGLRTYQFTGLSIPSGSRISARVQGAVTVGAVTIGLWVDLALNADIEQSAVVTYGANTATSAGTSVTPGSGAFGSWVAIGTTSTAHKAFTVSLDQLTDVSMNDVDSILQLSTGAAGAEVIFAEAIWCREESTNERFTGPFPSAVYASVASGVLINCRIASGSVEARGVIIYGI